MKVIARARELLSQDETAVVSFTKGQELRIEANGAGTSGNWVFNPAHRPDKVIFYHRDPASRLPTTDVYLADFVSASSSRKPKRHVISFQGCAQVGVAASQWREFAEASQNPVRILTAT